MLVTNTTQTVDIPHEPGNQLTFRALTGRELDAASTQAYVEGQKLAAQLTASMSESEVEKLKATMAEKAEKMADAKLVAQAEGEVEEVSIDGYDVQMVLAAGCIEFSGPLYDGAPEAMKDLVSLLERETETWAYGMVMRASLVPPA